MTVNTTREGNRLTIIPEDRIDTVTAPELDQVIADELGEASELVIDLGKVNYISSAGLRVLLTYAQEMDTREGSITAVNVNDRVREIFDMTGFLEILNVE